MNTQKTMRAKAVYIATARPMGLIVEAIDGTFYYAMIHPRESLLDRLKKCDQGWAKTAEKMPFSSFEAWHFYRIKIINE